MPKTIIVPIDVGHPDKAPEMLAIARKLGGDDARIVLINVVIDVPVYVAVELPGGLIEKAKENARSELTKIAGAAGVEAEIEVRNGQAATAILAAASEKHADVIIIASHHPDLSDYFLGSTAARVVRHASCSVHVMR